MSVRHAVCFVFLSGCAAITGLSDYELASDAKDGGTPTPAPGTDAASPAKACDESACAFDPKWTPFAFALSPATCPGAKIDAVMDPVAGDGACACAATSTVAPSCTDGTFTFKTCSDDGVKTTITGAGCTSISGKLAAEVVFPSLAPKGGSCTATSVANASKVATTPVTLCTPICKGDVCGRRPPAGFKACLAVDGDVACDVPGFGEKHLLGSSAQVACAECTSCAATATCDAVAIDFFVDNTCLAPVFSLPANACTSTGAHNGTNVNGIVYHATVNAMYAATGPLTATASLAEPRTVCCAP